MSQNATSETLGFQAEVKQLLHLMIHSLYSNKEIFLRELVSNASDACDKLRFEAIDNPALLEGDGELAITVSYDKDARTVTISDNGIGLSREEAVANLGTIARSGTREFFSQLTGDKQKDAQLIGQCARKELSKWLRAGGRWFQWISRRGARHRAGGPPIRPR